MGSCTMNQTLLCFNGLLMCFSILWRWIHPDFMFSTTSMLLKNRSSSCPRSVEMMLNQKNNIQQFQGHNSVFKLQQGKEMAATNDYPLSVSLQFTLLINWLIIEFMKCDKMMKTGLHSFTEPKVVFLLSSQANLLELIIINYNKNQQHLIFEKLKLTRHFWHLCFDCQNSCWLTFFC